ncbi:MAG: hypothetical protein JNL01_03805 [Bdellovibrionales bacterium]|nr:hypothetical protein [Bdellovibrionales bacterium]
MQNLVLLLATFAVPSLTLAQSNPFYNYEVVSVGRCKTSFQERGIPGISARNDFFVTLKTTYCKSAKLSDEKPKLITDIDENVFFKQRFNPGWPVDLFQGDFHRLKKEAILECEERRDELLSKVTENHRCTSKKGN